MSAQVGNDSLSVELRPSRVQRYLVATVHGLAALGLVTSDLPAWAYWLGVPAILISLLYQLKNPVPKIRGNPLVGLRVDAENAWALRARDMEHPARILDSSQLWVGVMFLRFSVEGRRVSLVLTPDSLGQNEFRRFRARLMTAAKPNPSF